MAYSLSDMADSCPKSPEGATHLRANKVHKKTAALAIGALGVVYGDIGTSPLYAVRECFNGMHAVAMNESVLSAIEGLEVATEAAKPFIVPLTCIVLVALFVLQKRGTSGLGRVFGLVMVLWFLTIAGLGSWEILQSPRILRALNPWHAWELFSANHLHGFVVLGSVVLCITWLGLACPALLLNYFGQCALLLNHPDAGFHPFYGLVPSPALYPMVALSTIATVIASQALISGAFSLTQQAIQLGFSPRLLIISRRYSVHPPPPCQAQPHAARSRGPADHSGGRRPDGGGRGPFAHRTPAVGVLSTVGLVRLHGNTECSESHAMSAQRPVRIDAWGTP
jgi:K+ transporter